MNDLSKHTNGKPKRVKLTPEKRRKLLAFKRLLDRARARAKQAKKEGEKGGETLLTARERAITRTKITERGTMESKYKALIIIFIIISITLVLCTSIYVLGNRYQLESNNRLFYKIDRISGQTWWIIGDERTLVKEKEDGS